MNVNPVAQLQAGVLILDPLLTKHGFVFGSIVDGKGSGGYFAHGDYIRNERRLELHYRYGLGVVAYHVGELSLSHLTYMKLLGVYHKSAFASNQLLSDLKGFDRLYADLSMFGEDFLEGDCKQFCVLASQFESNPNMFSGFRALPSN